MFERVKQDQVYHVYYQSSLEKGLFGPAAKK